MLNGSIIYSVIGGDTGVITEQCNEFLIMFKKFNV